MATHANSTRTPLVRQTTGSAGLLPAGLPSRRIVAAGGPVTRAIAVMRAADPDHPRVLSLRQKLAERIESDIALLDALDGDSDLEPTLGYIPPGYVDEGEPDLAGSYTDLEHDESELEPSLGSLGGTAVSRGAQLGWAGGAGDDREDEHDGSEPSLCGLTVDCPSRGGDDREAGDDNGIADDGGQHEQLQRFRRMGGDCNVINAWGLRV